MRKACFTAVAAAAILFGMWIDPAAASMTPTTPAALGVSAISLVHQATVVCGGNGCAPVHTSRVRRHFRHP